MKKKREWRKALSVMLAVSMMLQSCTVVSAGETEPEIIVEHEGQSSGDEKKETKKSDFPEISIESVVPETKTDGKDSNKSEVRKDAVFTITFAAQSADHGVIHVGETELNAETLSSYKKEIQGNTKYTFRVTAADGYTVERIKAGDQEIARAADQADVYEIGAVTGDTVIAVTYQKQSKQDKAAAEAAPEFQRAALTVGQQSYIMGQDGTDHTWDILDESVVSVLSTDGAIAELKANAEGTVYIAHSYFADGESDMRMETFEVTVAAGAQAAIEVPESESNGESKSEVSEETEALKTEDSEQADISESGDGEETEALNTETDGEAEVPKLENGGQTEALESENDEETEVAESKNDGETEVAESENDEETEVAESENDGETEVAKSENDGETEVAESENDEKTEAPETENGVETEAPESEDGEATETLQANTVEKKVTFEAAEGAIVTVDGVDATNAAAMTKNGTIEFTVIADEGYEVTGVLIEGNKEARLNQVNEKTDDYIIEGVLTDDTVVRVNTQAVISEAEVPEAIRKASARAAFASGAAEAGIMATAENEYTIQVGERLVLSGTADGSSHEWRSGNTSTAVVTGSGSTGTVQGINAGRVTITHRYKEGKNWKSETFQITVEKEYTLTFHANGGTNAPAAITVALDAENKEIILPGQGSMSRSGYTFMGWGETANSGMADQSNGGDVTIYPAGYAWLIEESKTLYAVWAQSDEAYYFVRLDGSIPTEPGSYSASDYTEKTANMKGTVRYNTFYANTVDGVDGHLGTIPSTSAIRIACNSKAGSIRFGDGSGYTQCWTDREFEEKYYVLWYVIKQKNPIHVDGVLLKKNLYNVSYNPNALDGQYTGTVPLGAQYAQGKKVTVLGADLKRDGYTFLGWSRNPSASEPEYVAGNTFTMPGENVVLYAVWRPNNNTAYRVEYYYQKQDGSYPDEATLTSDVRYGVTDRTVRVTGADKTPDAAYPDYTEDSTNEKKLYEASVKADGSTVLKVYFKRQVNIAGTKTWIDPVGSEHPEIVIELLRDGEKIDEIALEGETEYSFGKFDQFDEAGNPYNYMVREAAVNGYTTTYQGYDITNTIVQDNSIEVSGIKTWIAPADTEYPAITINLYRDGVQIDSVTLENGVTEYTFPNLPKYALDNGGDGHVYKYTVEETAVDGYTSVKDGNNFTNTIEQDDSIVISGTKTWIAPAGTVHPTVTVNLFRDGEKIDSQELENGTTEYRFANLPKYDLKDGHVYVYTVEEEAVTGYTGTQNGNDFTNTIAQDSGVSVSGTKTWIDPEGTQHPAITINLLRDGKKVDSVTLENGTTDFAFTGLDKYDLSDGHVYDYTVEEEDVEGYTSTQDGNSFTNTIAQDNSIVVSGTKTWIDPAGTEHPEITIYLLRDGVRVKTTTLADGETEYAFENLPKYDLTDGHIYQYTVEEAPVEGYASVRDGYDFTNTINQDNTVSVSGIKTWIAPEGTVHPTITVNLLRDGKEIQSQTLADGTTSYAFTGLDRYDLGDGHEYEYTVEEEAVDGYTSVQDGNNFTNTIAQDNSVSVSGTKTWIDPAGTVHPTITVTLLRDGEEAGNRELADGETEYAFENLPKYDLTDGHVYQYTVREEAVEGYTSVQNGNDFTNTIAQDTSVIVSGTKTWIDPAGTEHPEITIHLLRDGVRYDTKTLQNGQTGYSFAGLEKYDLSNGHEYVYTVEEEAVEGYTSVQTGNDFTNTIAQDNSVAISGTKTWIAPAGTEHPEITITLLRDGEEAGTTTLADGETEYVFENLPKYDLSDGHVYNYTVREEPAEGYTSVQTGNNFTNTIAQDTSVIVSGTKTWVDPKGTVHPTITVNLLRDGEKVASQRIADGTTTYMFAGLEKYDLSDGHVYEYTVEEEAVTGYTSVQDGTNFTNTIAQDNSVAVSGTKTWIAPAGTVHPTITVNLLRDGEEVDRQELANGITEYRFANLPKYDLTDGHVYEYTVEEESVAGYTSVQNGNNFTNTIAQDTSVVVSGTKTWIAPAGTVHPTITISLLRDGVTVDSLELADGTTEYRFEGLEKYDLSDGHVYEYTVKEKAVDGYTSVQNGNNFTNTIAQDNSIVVSGTKTWIAPAGTVHPTITINLLRDGVKIDSRELEHGTTEYRFENLDKYDLTDGHVYAYTVEEETVEGYSRRQNGTNFINTIAQDDSIVVSGTKTWIAPAGTVHPEITINLLRDGQEVNSVTLSDGETEYAFENLPKYDLKDGHVYVYRVEEEAVAGYTSTQNGTDFTNTIAQDNSIVVSGTKTWIAPEGTEHPAITINLLRDGEKVDSVTLENGTVDFAFTGLDKYDLSDGHVYDYTVEEETVEGYTSTQDGNNFTNTIAQDNSIAVSGTKTWIDPAGTEHPEITVYLLRDGERVETVTLTDGETEYAFENLPKYDLTDGHIYQYTVEEAPVEGYASVRDGYNFTNTINQDNTVSVSGIKTWIDPVGTEHPVITINLLRDGEEIDSQTLADGTTSYAFTGLDRYDLGDGHEYEYTVEEEAVEGYTSVQNGNNFTNTIAQDNSVSVSGTKTWIDPEGTVHPTITVTLLRDGEEAGSRELADGETEYVFENLPKYDLSDGHVYQYTVREEAVDGYTGVQNGNDFTNTIAQDMSVAVNGTKTWIDPAGTEHPEITIYLLRDGVRYDTKTLQNGQTGFSFTGLPKYDLSDGHVYEYRVEEEAVEGYTSVQNGNNFTNIIAQDNSVMVSGTKAWIDPAGTEHPEITITLLRDGVEAGTTTLADGETEYTFENLPKYDLSDGHVYSYTVREEPVEGYTSVQNGNNFTNTIAQDTSVVVSGTKTWIDPAGTVHPAITVNLLRDGVEIASRTLADGETEYTFENLEKYDLTDGHVYEYTVEEEAVDGYTSAKNGTDFTNTIAQDNSVAVSGTKTWIDPAGTEHPEITIQLLRDGEVAQRLTLADGETEYTFDRLPKYDLTDGHVYEYTVEEVPVEGYTGTQDGNDFTNTIAQDNSVVVSGTKTWNMIEGETYPSITVNLLRDGVIADSQVLENGATEYTFENLPKYAVGTVDGYTGAYDGHEFVYTVTENDVPGYTETQNGTALTNTADTTSVEVTKSWQDGEGNALVEELIPEALTVTLLRGGEAYGEPVQLNAENGWTHTFEGLPTHDETGAPYSYSVREEQVEGFTGAETVQAALKTAEITDGYEAGLVNVRNDETPVEPTKTHTAPKVQVEGTTQMVEVGETVTYAITYYNHNNTAADVTITDTLPAGLEYVESDPAAEVSGQTVTWTFEQVAPFTGGTVNVTARVTQEALTAANPVLDNRAEISLGDAQQETNTDSVTVYHPDWTVDKTVSGMTGEIGENGVQSARVGDELIYTVMVANTGNVTITKPITDIFMVDGEEANPQLYLYQAEGSQGNYENGNITLAPGETAILMSVYTVSATDNQLVNAVRAGSEPEDPEKQVPTDVEDNPDWTVEKQLVNGGSGANGAFVLGETALFDITVTNTGNTKLEDLTVSEIAGAVFTEDPEGRYTVDTQTNTAAVTLEEQEAVTIRAEYTIREADLNRTDLENVATATLGDKEVPSNPVPFIPEGRNPRLEVTKTVTSVPAAADGRYVAGEEITYQVRLRNTGNLTMQGLDVLDTLTRPENNGTVVPGGFEDVKVAFENAVLAPNEEITVTYSYIVTEQDLGGELMNAVTATGTPVVPNPDPERPDPNPGDEDEVPVVTEDPANSSIVVTKQLTDAFDNPVTIGAATFYVSLFEDEALTRRVGDVRAINFADTQATSGVTFDGLQRGVYYVAETDAQGNVLGANIEHEGGLFSPAYANGQQVTIAQNGANAEFGFANQFLVLPSGYYAYVTNLAITKNVRDSKGRAQKSDETFYAGVFLDEAHTRLATEDDGVSQSIIPISMSGNATATVNIEVANPEEGQRSFYITEVSANGTPVEKIANFAYDWEVENEVLTLESDTTDASVTITNTVAEQDEEHTDTVIEDPSDKTEQNGQNVEGAGMAKMNTKSVKTGDETPIFGFVLLLTTSALILLILEERRRRHRSEDNQ